MDSSTLSSIARHRYNSRPDIWLAEDPWNTYTHQRIGQVVRRLALRLDLSDKIALNLGSGGQDYGLEAATMVHADLAELRLPRSGFSVAGTALSLPFRSDSFDFILFVGTVLNYCDAVAAISEIARVLKPGGTVLMEFESSSAAEYLGQPEFSKAAVLVSKIFHRVEEPLWVYRPAHVASLLRAVGIEVTHDEGFHIGTGLAYLVLRSERLVMPFAGLDRLLSTSRPFRFLAANRVFLARKICRAGKGAT